MIQDFKNMANDILSWVRDNDIDRFLPGDTIVCDIDGTLRDPSHRLHLVPAPGSRGTTQQWGAFNMACGGDAPIQPVIDFINEMFARGKEIILLSGCTETAWQITKAWLLEHEVQYTSLIMRKEDDHRIAKLFKWEEIERIGVDKIWFAIDDDPDIVSFFDAQGLNVLQVARNAVEK